jgi:hypothetical protein
MAHVDAAYMQQIFDVAKRKRKPNLEHHRQADDLMAGSEVFERGILHRQTLRGRPARSRRIPSDKAICHAQADRNVFSSRKARQQ